jgi:tetratricopeptide (TPR) repeat protein
MLKPMQPLIRANVVVPLLLLTLPGVGRCADTVGVLAAPGAGSRYIRKDALTHFSAVAGELLEDGDRLLSLSTTALTHYPTNSSFTFTPAPTVVSFPLPRPQTSTGDLRLDQRSVRKLGKGELREVSWRTPLAMPGGPLPPVTVRPASSSSFPPLSADADPVLRADRAVRLERAGDLRSAIAEYERLSRAWPEAQWLTLRIASLRRRVDARPGTSPATRPGQTYAVLVAASSFQSPAIPAKPAAAIQVRLLERHLQGNTGGSVPATNIISLSGAAATRARIRQAFENTLRRRANSRDIVFIFIAGTEPSSSRGVLLTSVSDPREPRGTGLRLQELADLFQETREHVGRVLLLTNIDRLEQRTPVWNREPLARVLQASAGVSSSITTADQRRANEAFDARLRDALAGGANVDRNDIITPDELLRYMDPRRGDPPRAANQTPRAAVVSAGFARLPRTLASAARFAGMLWQVAAPSDSADFAFEDARREAEDEAQQIILRYLDGDEHPLVAADFERGLRLMNTPAALNGDDPASRERYFFFLGRVLTFRGEFSSAAQALQNAVLIDPDSAYTFNALGIAWLEQGLYADAVRAFRDSVARAPAWTYPWHNLALAYTETGDYDQADAAYRHAIVLQPNYARLHHNRGVLLHRLNRMAEAEAEYHRAIVLSSDSDPEARLALAVLQATRGRTASAEQAYRKLLASSGQWQPATRHNLATLLYQNPKSRNAAIELWHENRAFLPSQYRLAVAYASFGRYAEAATEYRAILDVRPDSLATRFALLRALIGARDWTGVRAEIELASLYMLRVPTAGDLQK